MSTKTNHDVVHAPTGWVVAAGLALPQANAVRHALARRPDGSSLTGHAAAGDAQALKILRDLVASTLAAALRQSSIDAAQAGKPVPAVQMSADETIRRLKVALSAFSGATWVLDITRGVVIVRPPVTSTRDAAAHASEHRRVLAQAFGFVPEEPEVLIPPEGRATFVAKAEAEALRVLQRARASENQRSGGGAAMMNAPTSGSSETIAASPLGLLLARMLGDAHEPLDFVEIVDKVKRARKSETPAAILRALDAMCVTGYARELPGPTFVTGS